MSKHYIFWPFASGQYVDMGGVAHGAGRELRDFRRPVGSTAFIRYGSKKHRARLESCSSPDKSIYVTGHGTSGIEYITNTPTGNDEVLGADVVVGD